MKRGWLLLLLLLAPLVLVTQARADDLYVVRDVAVDVSDVSAVEARRKAMQEAQLLGYHRLVRRLTLQQDWQRLPRPTFDEIQSMIDSLEIEEEKSSTTRYLANVTMTFNPDALHGLLSQAEIGFLEFAPLTALALPLYYNGTEWVLWRKPNPWWEAWENLNASLLSVSYLLPLADLEDRLTLPAAQVDEAAQLGAFAARYNVDRILLARARPNPDGNDELDVEVSVYRLLPSSSEATQLGRFDFSAPNMGKGVANIAERMEQDWKARSIQEQDDPSTFRLRARFASIEEWMRMRRSLQDASYIRDLEVEEIDIGGAWLRLGFNGSGQTLVAGLRRNGFLVAQESDAFDLERPPIWTLRLAGEISETP